jgi:hypothetical protein
MATKGPELGSIDSLEKVRVGSWSGLSIRLRPFFATT